MVARDPHPLLKVRTAGYLYECTNNMVLSTKKPSPRKHILLDQHRVILGDFPYTALG